MRPGSFAVRHTVDIDFFSLILNLQVLFYFFPYLDIKDAGILIVLDSPLPLKWRLKFFGHNEKNYAKPRVVHAPGSSVAESNLEINLLKSDFKMMRLSPKMSDEKFGTIGKSKFCYQISPLGCYFHLDIN